MRVFFLPTQLWQFLSQSVDKSCETQDQFLIFSIHAYLICQSKRACMCVEILLNSKSQFKNIGPPIFIESPVSLSHDLFSNQMAFRKNFETHKKRISQIALIQHIEQYVNDKPAEHSKEFQEQIYKPEKTLELILQVRIL